MAIEARPVGFFTDTSICIGCKACEVACKEWNQLEGNKPEFLADSYDNTGQLDSQNWRHVAFVETLPSADGAASNGNGGKIGGAAVIPTPIAGGQAWLMMSDVCKHCVQAGCLEVCPTGAIMRTEFDTVYIQQDVCNGCRYCVAGCPFGVIEMNERGVAGKCTMCYDRLEAGLTPACAQACPTASIQFGPIDQLQQHADTRLATLQQMGRTQARLYGRDTSILGGLNAFFLIEDAPAVYGLPESPKLPSRNLPASAGFGLVAAALAGLAGLIAFRKHRMDPANPTDTAEGPANAA